MEHMNIEAATLLTMIAAMPYIAWLGYSHQNPALSLAGVLLNGILLFMVMPASFPLATSLARLAFVIVSVGLVATVCACISARHT